MTNPKHTDTSRSGDLVKRARAKWKALPTQGGGSVAIGGHASHYVTDDGMRLINPDGPALADRIEALEAEIERLREALKVTHNLAVTYAVGSGTLFYEAMAEARAALGEKQ